VSTARLIGHPDVNATGNIARRLVFNASGREVEDFAANASALRRERSIDASYVANGACLAAIAQAMADLEGETEAATRTAI